MRKQGLLHGSVILLVSAVLTKLVGALFKLPLTNLLGGAGMGLFGCAYGLFLPVYALCVSGMSAAVAKQTAAAAACGEYATVKRLRRLALLWFSGIGLLGTAGMLLAAEWFCTRVVGCPAATLSVAVLAPSVLLGCVSAVYRGYYEGLRNMYPTALSQLAEACVRLGCGLWFCRWTLSHSDRVLALLPPGTDALSAASAAAVCGVTASTLGGTLFLILLDALRGDGISRAMCKKAPPPASSRAISRGLFSVLLPIALGALVTNLTSLVDLATGIRGLTIAAARSPERFAAWVEGNPAQVATFLFGSFTGLAITVFNLVPSVTNMLGKSALPAVAAAKAGGDLPALARDSCLVLRTTGLLALPAGFGLAFLAQPILLFLFPHRVAEVLAAAPSLAWLGLGVAPLAVSCTVFSMLQAIGRARRPVEIMLVGVAVKLIGNLLLIPIPRLHIAGAGISTTLCYCLMAGMALRSYQRETGVRLHWFALLWKPAYAGLLCAMTAAPAATLLGGMLGVWALPAGILCGGAVYLIVLRTLR